MRPICQSQIIIQDALEGIASGGGNARSLKKKKTIVLVVRVETTLN